MIRLLFKKVLAVVSVIAFAMIAVPIGGASDEGPGFPSYAVVDLEPTITQETQPVLTKTQVSERIWMFSGRGGNIGVIITDDGVVVIDTQYENVAPILVEQIRTLTDQPIRYIINTHIHGDHVGGNAYLQQYGSIIAHQNTYDRMLARWEGEGAPGKGDGFPQLTFRDSFTLNIGGIEIQLFNLGRGHTDTDVVVWIPSENVVHVGDLLFNRMTPYVDKSNGSHTGMWITVINQVIQRINSDTRVIPGHGELSDVDGFRNMARYFQAVRRIVQTAHSEGKTKEEILSLTLADLGERFADWSGNRLSMALSAAYTEIIGNGPTLLVVNKGENTVAFVDVETGDVRQKVATGPNPHEVAVTPDGQLAYVTNYGSGRPAGTRCWMSVVDVPGMRVLRDIELKNPATGDYLSAPHGVMVTLDGSSLWVTVEGSGGVARIDLPEEKVTAFYETGQRVSHQVVPLPNGSKAYVANIGSGSVSVVDVSSGSVTTIECRPGTEGIDVSPDGRWIWATNRQDGTVSIIDSDSDRVVKTIQSGAFPIRVKFTTDGKLALVSNAEDGEVAVFDASTHTLLRTISTGAMPIGLLILPDGSRAYVANTQSDMVSILDLKGWKVSGTISTGREPDGLALAIYK